MKKRWIILAPFFLFGCTVTMKVNYKTDDIVVNPTIKTFPAMVDVRILNDNRVNLEENSILFKKPRQIILNGKQTCINSEKHYVKDTVVNQMTHLMVDHFNKAKLFSMSFYNQNPNSKYYLSGTLNQFYAEQEYSTASAIGASFGLIGAVATAGIKTPGKVIIEISDLKLFKNDGSLIKDFGGFYKEYTDDFKADANCWCVYWNANEMLKDFNTNLIEKIRNDLNGVLLE